MLFPTIPRTRMELAAMVFACTSLVVVMALMVFSLIGLMNGDIEKWKSIHEAAEIENGKRLASFRNRCLMSGGTLTEIVGGTGWTKSLECVGSKQ